MSLSFRFLKQLMWPLILVFITSCALPSGRYVYQSGEWVFKKSNTGFAKELGGNNYFSDDSSTPYLGKVHFSWPLPYSKKVSSGYGLRHGKMHDGIDIAAPKGTSILAAADGIVHYAGWMKGYGRIIILKHGEGLKSVYAHNSKNLVKKGRKVVAGQVIAKVGNSGRSSGNHLHFEIRKNKMAMNPMKYLSSKASRLAINSSRP